MKTFLCVILISFGVMASTAAGVATANGSDEKAASGWSAAPHERGPKGS